MIVQIQSAADNKTPEWALIELNGELVPPKGQNDENDDNLVESNRVELGSLKFSPEVSIHTLSGWMEFPFVVVKMIQQQ